MFALSRGSQEPAVRVANYAFPGGGRWHEVTDEAPNKIPIFEPREKIFSEACAIFFYPYQIWQISIVMYYFAI